MKKKYLKKMLAIMLASMTVAATPGLVGAMKEESKNKINDVNAQIANHELNTNEATAFLDKLEEFANEDDDAKKEVAKTLGAMINEGLFKRPLVTIGYYLPGAFEQQTRPPEYLSKIINILKNCLSCVGARKDVSKAVENMASKNLLGRASTYGEYQFILQCSPEQFSGIMDILDICLNDDNYGTQQQDYTQIKRHVIQAVSEMASKGVFGFADESDLWGNRFGGAQAPFDGRDYELFTETSRRCSDDQLCKIMQFLNKCVQGNEITVAKIINELVEKKLLNERQNPQTLKILQECLKNSDAKKQVLDAIRNFIDKNLCDKNSINQILDMLKICSESDETIEFVASAIDDLVRRNLFESDSLDSVLYILLKCSNYGKSIQSVIQSTKEIIQNDLLNQHESYKIQQMINLLINISRYDKFKAQGLELISILEAKGLLNQNQIRQIADGLKALLKENDFQAKEIAAAGAMIKNLNVLNKLSDFQIQKIIDLLPRAFANNNTREASTSLLLDMTEHDVINKFNNAQIQQILGFFKEQVKTYLAVGNYEMVDEIFTILAFRSTDVNLREHVADVIDALSRDFNFYRYLNENTQIPRLENVLETLISCTQSQNERTCEKAIDVIASVFVNTSTPQIPGIQYAINGIIGATAQTITQINNKIPQIIEMLQRLSTVRGSKKDVALIIDSLGKRGFFRELPQEGQSRLIATLRNLLTYNGRQIASDDFNLSDLEMEDRNHADALPTVCNLFRTMWMATLFANNILPANVQEFNRVSNDILIVGQKLG